MGMVLVTSNGTGIIVETQKQHQYAHINKTGFCHYTGLCNVCSCMSGLGYL